ncbi:PEGA domain-containing protein [bacterium]|nr:PEGA domain-containing protein [bacterium]
MLKRTRTILVIILAISFIIAVPFIILYAKGYSFDFKNKKIVLTGGIFLNSIPKKANVYINNKYTKKRTPCLIKRLIPQEYVIEVKKQGFHSWKKHMKVKPNLVREAKNIMLIPEKLNPEMVKPLSSEFSLNKFLYPDIYQTNLKLKENFSTTTLGYTLSNDYVLYIKKIDRILYKIKLNDFIRNEFSETQINISPLPESEYKIYASAKNIAVLDKNGTLYIFDKPKRKFNVLAKNVKGLEFSEDEEKLLYFTNSEIWVYYLKNGSNFPFLKKGEKQLITRVSKTIKKAIWYPLTNYHIIFKVNGNLKIIELDSDYPRNNINLFSNVEDFSYSKSDKKLYFIKNNILFRIKLNKH